MDFRFWGKSYGQIVGAALGDRPPCLPGQLQESNN